MSSTAKQTQQTSLTILSQMMGAALLSCSFIVYKLGWVLSIVVFALTIGYCSFVFKYFIDIAHYLQASSYREMTEKALNKTLSMVLDVGIIISYFGFVTAYIIISSTAVLGFAKNVFGQEWNPYVVKAVLASCVIFPLCLLKSLKQLSKVASVSGVAILITAVTIIVYFFMHVKEGVLCTPTDRAPIKYGLRAWPKGNAMNAILVFLMYIPSLQGNFSAHTVIPTLIKELQGPPVIKKRVVSVSLIIGMSLAAVLYLFVGFMGAGMFGEGIQDNLLRSFQPCKWLWTDIVSLIYALVVIIAYPLVLYPIKVSICGMFHHDPSTKSGYRVMTITSIIFIVCSCGLAMVLESIVAIFGLFSSLAGAIQYFLVPLLFYLKWPKVKRDNIHMDHLQEGVHTVDPVLVGVLSMVSPSIDKTTIERVRTLSNKLFKPMSVEKSDDEKPTRKLSMFRTRSMSIKIEDGVEKIRTNSIARRPSYMNQHDSDEAAEQLLVESPIPNDKTSQSRSAPSQTRAGSSTAGKIPLVDEEHVQGTLEIATEQAAIEGSEDTVEEYFVDEHFTGEITKMRKLGTWTVVGLFILICAEGVVMNGIDVFNTFK